MAVTAQRLHELIFLMDINLPDINGIEALKILQDDPLTKHSPIIALSASAMRHDIEKGLPVSMVILYKTPRHCLVPWSLAGCRSG